MTPRRSILPGLFLLGVVGGCTSSTVDGPIDFSASGGFNGGGNGTPTLHIELDGTATRPKVGGGTETAMLDPATVADLHHKIEDADFATLAPMYECGGCADGFIYTVSVQLDGSVHSVVADDLAPWPDGLTTVINTLKDISQRPLDWQ